MTLALIVLGIVVVLCGIIAVRVIRMEQIAQRDKDRKSD